MISALALPAGIDSNPQDQNGCAFTASLGSPPAPAVTGTISTRLFRGGVQGGCSTNTFPGNSGSGAFHLTLIPSRIPPLRRFAWR